MAEAVYPDDKVPGYHINPSGNEAKERAKWEQFPQTFTSVYGVGNPYVYRPYPKMLYKAGHFKGKVVCLAAEPDSSEYRDARDYQVAESQAKKFNDACMLIVNNDIEHSRAMERGYRESPQEAVDHVLAMDRGVANSAAERNWQDRNMSELAKREIEAKIAEVGGEHLPEIERTPIKRKGGWPKGKPRHKAAS